MDKIKEFLKDFHNNWDNSYWWVDHQWLMAILLSIGIFAITVGQELVLNKIRNTGVTV